MEANTQLNKKYENIIKDVVELKEWHSRLYNENVKLIQEIDIEGRKEIIQESKTNFYTIYTHIDHLKYLAWILDSADELVCLDDQEILYNEELRNAIKTKIREVEKKDNQQKETLISEIVEKNNRIQELEHQMDLLKSMDNARLRPLF